MVLGTSISRICEVGFFSSGSLVQTRLSCSIHNESTPIAVVGRSSVWSSGLLWPVAEILILADFC